MNLVDRDKLESFLRAHGLAPQKKFGQNFLVDESVLAGIVAAADLNKTDRVVEIGAGLGTLTRELASQAEQVTALEYDASIFPALTQNLNERKNVQLLNLDVRKFEPPAGKYKLVANIPYYLTSPILRQFFVDTENRPDLTVLLIQKEVAERICHPTKNSVLSWQVRIFGEPELVLKVPRGSFLPPPKVESAVIRIKLLPEPLVSKQDLGEFFELLHAGFRAPRKKIGGSLIAGLPYEKAVSQKILTDSGVDPDQRPEDLKIMDWQALLAAVRTNKK